MPTKPHDHADLIDLHAAASCTEVPRVILLTTRGHNRTIGKVLSDLAAALDAGISDTSSEHCSLHTNVPPGSLIQIYAAPRR